MAEDLVKFDTDDVYAIPPEVEARYGKNGVKVFYYWESSDPKRLNIALNRRYKGIGYQVCRWPDAIIKERGLTESAVTHMDSILLVGDIILKQVSDQVTQRRRELKWNAIKPALADEIKNPKTGTPKVEVVGNIEKIKGRAPQKEDDDDKD